MKKACGLAIGIYAACAAVGAAVIYRRLPEMEIVWVPALLAAIPLWFVVTYIWEVFRRFGAMRTFRRAQSGEPPHDGEKVMAIGRITPTGEPLESPFTRTPCVMYEYKIITGWGEHDSSLYTGFAQNPSSIQTPRGSIRLLAYPDMKFTEQTIDREQALPNAKEFIANTQFRETTLGSVGSSFKELMDVYKDDDGTVRFDNKVAGDQSIEQAYFVEKLVRAGDEVCVIGNYSEQRRGIVPNLKSPLIEQATIEPGSGDAPLRRARKGAIGYAIGAAIFGLVVAVALVIFLALNPLEATEAAHPELKPTWVEIKLEWLIDRWVRDPMRQAGMLTPPVIVNRVAAGAATGRVTTEEQDIAVSRTTLEGLSEQTIVRIDGKIVVLVLDDHYRPTALVILGRDAPPESAEVDHNGYEVWGRINHRGDPTCRVAFRVRLPPR